MWPCGAYDSDEVVVGVRGSEERSRSITIRGHQILRHCNEPPVK